ncbi:hypothetical protein M9458_052252, partial [Cirrhinus mrigala]
MIQITPAASTTAATPTSLGATSSPTFIPATPIPIGQRVEMIACLCFVNTLALHRSTIALQRCSGRKGKYSPS